MFLVLKPRTHFMNVNDKVKHCLFVSSFLSGLIKLVVGIFRSFSPFASLPPSLLCSAHMFFAVGVFLLLFPQLKLLKRMCANQSGRVMDWTCVSALTWPLCLYLLF